MQTSKYYFRSILDWFVSSDLALKMLRWTVLSFAVFFAGCSLHYHTYLGSAKDIKKAKADTYDFNLTFLPIEDYPLLTRFAHLRDIYYDQHEDERGATDEKLVALAAVDLPNLSMIAVNGCESVTDRGIQALAGIPTLRGLGIQATSVTDESMRVIAEEMQVEVLNLANCRNVTLKGLQTLITSKTLRRITFSADGFSRKDFTDGLSQEDIVSLIMSNDTITWWSIVDFESRLDGKALAALGAERNIHVDVQGMAITRPE